ncbi:hypothetical protein [Actinomadura sp. KC216]|nr:hypothetical protein [Actinomadura sp. KC216]
MRKGNRIGRGVTRLMIALFALAALTVIVKELPAPRRRRRAKKSG